MHTENILIARQPIYDVSLNVTAYELLFRPTQEQAGNPWDGDQATSQVLLNVFAEMGMGIAADNKRAFINFTRSWLESPPPFEPGSITIEILEDIEPTPNMVKAIQALSAQGYQIALDDFVYKPELEPLIELADIIKIDVLAVQGDELETLVKNVKHSKALLLAEKVEHYNVFEHCKQLGFSLFQGYFLCRPQIIEGTSIPSNKLVVMRLMGEIQNPEVSMAELETIIANDPALSVKLMRIFTTAQYATRAKVDSIRKAIVLLGLQKLKSWACLIALSRLSDKPSELIMMTLTRAKMLELIAQKMKADGVDSYFTTGLFSTIDAFFDQDKFAILETLPLEARVNDAILKFEGESGKILQAVVDFEQGHWQQVDWALLRDKGIDEPTMEAAYLEALSWATSIMRSLLDNH